MAGASLAPGTTVDRYLIEGILGRGGFGVVYRARHTVIDRPVALKVLRLERDQSPEVVERFLLEAKAAARVGSPHIVQVMDAGRSATGQSFLAMELLEGEDLQHRIRRAGTLPVPVALGIAVQILDGLAAAHAQGIVHRDMKPANVFLITASDGSDFVKLLDFGISKVLESGSISSLTKTGVMLGTPHYMAPEQIRNSRDVDGRADLYSASVILYQMLSGMLPYDAESYEQLILKVHHEPPVSLAEAAPQIPQALRRVVERGLARDPDARWQSAGELSAALQSTWRASGGMLASPPTEPLEGYGRGDPAAKTAAESPLDPTRPLGAQGPRSDPGPQRMNGPAVLQGPGTPPTRFSPHSAPPQGASWPVVGGAPESSSQGMERRGRTTLSWTLIVLGGLLAAAASAGLVVFALNHWASEPMPDDALVPVSAEPLEPVRLEGSPPKPLAIRGEDSADEDGADEDSAGEDSADAGRPVEVESEEEEEEAAQSSAQARSKRRNKRRRAAAMSAPSGGGDSSSVRGAESLIRTAREPAADPAPPSSPPDSPPVRTPTLGRVDFRFGRVFNVHGAERQAVLAMLRRIEPRIRRCMHTNEEVQIQVQTIAGGRILSVRTMLSTPTGGCVARVVRSVGRIEGRGVGIVRFYAQRAQH